MLKLSDGRTHARWRSGLLPPPPMPKKRPGRRPGGLSAYGYAMIEFAERGLIEAKFTFYVLSDEVPNSPAKCAS